MHERGGWSSLRSAVVPLPPCRPVRVSVPRLFPYRTTTDLVGWRSGRPVSQAPRESSNALLAIAVLFNPTRSNISQPLDIPLYYAGAAAGASVACVQEEGWEDDAAAAPVSGVIVLDARSRATGVPIAVQANSQTYVVCREV